MPKNTPTVPVLFQHAYDLAIWYSERMERFPKAYRFTLADRIQEGLLVLVERIQDTVLGKHRKESLGQAQNIVDRLRLWNRMAKDLRCLDTKQYAFAAERIEAIGKQIGGWRRSLGALLSGDEGGKPHSARRELEQQPEEHPLREPQQERSHEPQQQRGRAAGAAQAPSVGGVQPGPDRHGRPGAGGETTTFVPAPRGESGWGPTDEDPRGRI